MESVALLLSFLVLGTGSGKHEAQQTEKPSTYQGKTVTEWRDALKDQDAVKRLKAANALGNIGPEARSAISQILSAFRDEKLADVRAELAWAICELGRRPKAPSRNWP